MAQSLQFEDGSQSEEKSYTEKYLEKTSKFQSDLLLDQKTRQKAEGYGDRLSEPYKSHYKPVHLAAAAIHIASRKNDSPRSIKQIAAEIDSGLFSRNEDKKHKQIKKVRRSVKKIVRNLDLSLNPVTAGDYLPYFYKVLNIKQENRQHIERVHAKIQGYPTFCGRSKLAVAAAVVHQAGKRYDDVTEFSCKELEQQINQDSRTIQRSSNVIEDILEDEGYIGRDELKQDLRRVNQKCEGNISQSKYGDLGKFSVDTIRRNFDSWKEALMEAGIQKKSSKIPKSALIRDMEEVFEEHEKLTQSLYDEVGEFSYRTVARRFDSWDAAKQQVK